MYKLLLSASVAAIVALFLAYTQLYTDSSVSLILKRNAKTYSTMNSTQLSRSVTKRVLAIEQSEVCSITDKRYYCAHDIHGSVGSWRSRPQIHRDGKAQKLDALLDARSFPCLQGSSTYCVTKLIYMPCS